MRVLLTNDDGIHAPGLWELVEVFSRRHQVTVVAPDRERSAVSHGITLHQPIRYKVVRKKDEVTAFAVSGTPADCVKLALAKLLDHRPDLVVSGINPGANVGINLNYSGTVAAAKEATLSGIPAMAVSVKVPGNEWDAVVANFIESLSAQMMRMNLPVGTFLNVNVPNLPFEKIRGVRWCKQGNGLNRQFFEERLDPRDRGYYWQGVDEQALYAEPDVDGSALVERYVSITPVRCDMTDHDTLKKLSGWEIPFEGNGERHG